MGNANSTAPPPKGALDIDGIARYLPDPAVVCERAGSAKQLFQLLFTRLRIARERLESVWPKCDADNRTQFMELLFKVNELALAYCHYTFGLRIAQHKITYDQVCGLREGFDALFVALGVQDETQDWDQDVDKAYAELVATLEAKANDDEYLRAMYTCDEALREHDLNVLDQAQDSTDGKQSSDIARALQSKLFHWAKDTSAKNAVKNGPKATTADKKTNESSLLVQRCQICLLGSTGAGKSSLLNSIVAAEPRLATRTDPADIVKQSSLTFQSAKQPTQRYEVSCWDLGVDTPHGLYFTPKTLFLVCVDLQAYAAQLQRGDERFALDNVFTWLETICTSQSNAEIAVVGTKSDLLDAGHMKEVQDDFKRRVQLWAQSFIELVHVSVRWPIETSLDQLIDRGLVVAGIKDVESSNKTRLTIEDMIDSGKDLSQPMSIRDLRVLDVVQRRRAEAARFTGKARLDRLIVPVSLIKALSRQVEDLAIENCEISLLALRDVREIMWFNGPSDPVDQLIALDPSIVQPHVLQEVLFPHNEDDVMDDDTLSTVIQLLCSHGAKWDKACEERWTELREEAEDDFASEDTLVQAGLASCAQLWLGARQKNPLKPLINVPFGVIKEGEVSVKIYFKEVTNARMEELVFRCKVCVVGTGFGGKTSLIKSASRLKPQLQEKLDRTIGIDFFPIQFAHTEEAAQGLTQTKNYEVTCWDFAGQDVYQVAHTLFFSKQTLYLLCLDLDDYSKKLDDNSGGDWMKDERLQRHLQDHVFRWTRLIFARQPDAAIVVIGTKADMVPSQEQIKRIFTDFDQRINTWVDNYIMELDVERRAVVEENLLFLRAGKRYAVSVKTQEDVEEAFKTIKALILSKPSLSIAMPPLYNEVLKAVHTVRREAATAADQRALVEKVVVRDRILIPKLQAKIEGLDGDVCRRILATFHNLGDILWYQQVGSGQLKEIIILQPTLALNIVREVIDHNHANSKEARFKRLKDDGEMAHDLLMTFGLWKALSDVRKDLVLFFKNLLWLFHLAYPVGTNEMMVTSDLIVPTYWQSKRLDAKQASEQKPLQRKLTALQYRNVSNASAATWQYEVPMEIARTIFDQFIVASHSKLFKRVVTVQSVQASMPGNFEARIIHQAGTGSTSVDYIKIEVVGATDDACWERMRFFVMAMERILDGYPGLTFHRELVRQDNSKEKTEPVDKALRELAEAQESGLSVASVRRRMPWLPPSLRWFTEKAWRTQGVLEKIDAEESIKRIEHMTGTLRTMMETADTKDHFPAVWTIEYEENASSLWLRLFSEVSGICYHPPIRIPLPPKILSDYGGLILAGVSLFSLIPLPGAGLVKDIVDKAVEITMCGMIDALDDAVESAKVHEFAELANGGSSNEMYSREQGTLLLQALLTAKDSSFSMLKVPQLTGLVCAAQPDGRFVWASESEIEAMKRTFPDLVIRGAGPPRVESHVDVSISIKSVVGLAKKDWRRVRCAWELVSTRDSIRMDGNTDVHNEKNMIPVWSDACWAKHRMSSLTALRDYELTIKVQHRSGLMKQLLNTELVTLLCGTVRLNDIIPEQHVDKTFRFEGEVPMERDSSTKIEFVMEIGPNLAHPGDLVLKALQLSHYKTRIVPALWTIRYSGRQQGDGKPNAWIRLHSDFSGLCYHEAIAICIPPAFLARRGAWIQPGYSVFATVRATALTDRIVEIVKRLTPPAEGEGSRHRQAHDFTCKSSLHPLLERHSEEDRGRLARSLLLELLALHERPIHEPDVLEKASLVCTATKEGHFVLMHSREASGMAFTVQIIPSEVFKSGVRSIETYLGLLNADISRAVYRRKICVVGPTRAGKTSLVRSILSTRCELVSLEDRTIGIDRFPHVFTPFGSASATFEATFWDFAGQNVYRVAHSLFFSTRTLFLLCVDMRAYVEELFSKEDVWAPEKHKEQRLTRQLHQRLFQWARLILARCTDAELVLVGTKTDGLREDQLHCAQQDLRERFHKWADRYVAGLQGATREAVKKSLDQWKESELLVNVHDLSAVLHARDQVEQLIVGSRERAFLMPAMYSRVLKAINAMRHGVDESSSSGDRVRQLIVPSATLVATLTNSIKGLSWTDCRTILRTLHDLGDILWYDRRRGSGGEGEDVVILEPGIVLDILREVVNHNYEDQDQAVYAALQASGELRHELLVTFELWQALVQHGTGLVLFFKQLLQRFNLAYPAKDTAMMWDSDLIVPTYWKLKKKKTEEEKVDGTLQGRREGTLEGTLVGTLCPYEVCWQFVVSAELSETLFDQFAVQSYCGEWVRSVASFGMRVSTEGTMVAVVETLESAKPGLDVIRLHVAAVDGDVGWSTMARLVRAMEMVLDKFPGVVETVERQLVRQSTRSSCRIDVHSVLQLVKRLQQSRSQRQPDQEPPTSSGAGTVAVCEAVGCPEKTEDDGDSQWSRSFGEKQFALVREYVRQVEHRGTMAARAAGGWWLAGSA